jgi:hypothetical protein
MNFLELQNKLADLTLDNRTEWKTWWVKNKQMLNEALWIVFNKIIIETDVHNTMKTQKTKMTIVDKKYTLPNDFKTLVWVYRKVLDNYNLIALDDGVFRLFIEWNTKKIIFEINITDEFYIEYIKQINVLSNNNDIPSIPSEFHEDIVNYALVEYHRLQRDWDEVSNSLAYAEGKIKEHIDNYWINV